MNVFSVQLLALRF